MPMLLIGYPTIKAVGMFPHNLTDKKSGSLNSFSKLFKLPAPLISTFLRYSISDCDINTPYLICSMKIKSIPFPYL